MSSLDGWEAATSDGRYWHDGHKDLQVADRSPWRELERLSAELGTAVTWAQVNLGRRYVRFEANGRVLTCGELLTQTLSLTGEGNVVRRYRWVRRDEPTRRLWGVVGYTGIWQFETPPDCEACPDPEAQGA